jgi:hypothetical protein
MQRAGRHRRKAGRHTKTARRCQQWNADFPHKRTQKFIPNTSNDRNSNYCRDSCLYKTKTWVHIHRLVRTIFLGEKSFYWKTDPTFSTPFLFIRYSKTKYQKHHIHVNIQNIIKLRHIFNRKHTLKCNMNNNNCKCCPVNQGYKDKDALWNQNDFICCYIV